MIKITDVLDHFTDEAAYINVRHSLQMNGYLWYKAGGEIRPTKKFKKAVTNCRGVKQALEVLEFTDNHPDCKQIPHMTFEEFIGDMF